MPAVDGVLTKEKREGRASQTEAELSNSWMQSRVWLDQDAGGRNIAWTRGGKENTGKTREPDDHGP